MIDIFEARRSESVVIKTWFKKNRESVRTTFYNGWVAFLKWLKEDTSIEIVKKSDLKWTKWYFLYWFSMWDLHGHVSENI